MKRNILRFLSTGRYIEATKLMVFHQTAETLFYANSLAPATNMQVTVTHPEMASRAGYFMDHIGQVTSASHPNIQNVMKVAATSLALGPKKNHSRWSAWTNNGLVFPIIIDNPNAAILDDEKTKQTAEKKKNSKAKNFKVTFSFPLSTIEEGTEFEDMNAQTESSNNGDNIAVGGAIKTLTTHAANVCRDEVFQEEEEMIPTSENGITFVLADGGGSLVRHTEIPLSSCASSSGESNPAIDVFYYMPPELPNDGPQSVYSQMMKNPLNIRSFAGEPSTAEIKEPEEEQWPEEEEELDEQQLLAGEQPDEKFKGYHAEQWQEEKQEGEESDCSVPIPDDESICSTAKPETIHPTECGDEIKLEVTDTA